MTSCGWCHTHFSDWQPQCSFCNGSLPSPGGMDLSPPPPAATPRTYPHGFVLRTVLTHNFPVWSGLLLALVGSLFTLVPHATHSWIALFPVCFILCGIFILVQGIRPALTSLRAFRHGIPAVGTIHSIARQHTSRFGWINPSCVLTYRFAIDGQIQVGKLLSLNSAISRKQLGQSLWVLYLPEAPGISTVYPPTK